MKQEKLKRIFRKRNIIFAISFLLVAALATSFLASCDGGDPPPVDPANDQPSTMLETPTDGSCPTDHDAKSNAYYALYAMNKLNSFTVDVEGETISKKGVTATQKIKAYRVINDGEVYKQNVSYSAFKKVGVRLFVKGDNYVVHNAKKVSSIDNITWESNALRVSKELYMQTYGYVPNSVTSYVLTDETILSAQYLGEEDGIYSFYYELDTVKATGPLSIEMRTMGGTDSLPEFEKASITIRMNKDWQVTELVTSSTYKMAMLGGVTCNESVVEKFGNYDKGIAVPNSDFYNTYVDAEIAEPTPVTLTATDYLMAGFENYITGEKPLKVSANLTSNQLCADLDAVVALNMEDIASTSVGISLKNAMYQGVNLSNIQLFYENAKIYLNAGNFKAVTNIDEISAVANEVCSLFGLSMPNIDSVDLASFDFETLISSATLEETDTLATVYLPVTLADTTINVQFVFSKGEQIAINQITATIGEVEILLQVNDDILAPQKGEGHHAITQLLQIVSENIAVEVEIGNVTTVASINLKTMQLDAYVDNLVLGDVALQDVKAKLVNNTIYADVLGLKAKLSLDDVQPLLDKLSFVLGDKIALPNMDALQSIDMMALVAEAINSLASQQTQDGLSISLSAFGLDFNLLLTITQQGYALGNVAVDVEGTNVTASLFEGEIPAISNDELASYNNVATLLDVIEDNQINLKVNELGLDVDLNVDLTNFTILVKTTLYGETLYAKIAEEKVYVSYKGLNGYVALADLEKVLDKLGVFIGEIELPDFSKITAEEVINSLTVTDTDVVTIALNLCGINANVVLDKTNGLTLSSVAATMQGVEITATPSKKADYSAMPTSEYYNLVSLLDVVDKDGKISIVAQAFGATIYATIDLPNNQILVALDDFEILVDLTEMVAYARYPGANLKLNLDEMEVVLKELQPILTKFVTQEEFDSINLNSFKDISIEEVVSSLVVTETESALQICLAIADINATITADKAQNGLTISGGNIKMGAIEATFETTTVPLEFTFDKTADYIGVTELVQTFAPALANILTLDNLYASMKAKLVLGNTVYELTQCDVLIANIYSAPKARANITLKITTTIDGNESVSEHKITLFYQDPSLVGEGEVNTYFTYDNTADADVLAGTFTTVNFYETLNIVKQIYANMPELQDALKPFIVADENSMPQFMDLDVDFSKLINASYFEEGVLSVDANAKAVLSDLSNSVWLNLFSKDGLLCLDIDELAFNNSLVTLSASVGEAPEGLITDDKFEFTPLDNANDFSSINELLMALEKTSQKRHFFIDAKLDLTGSGDLELLLKVKDKISIKLYLDVIDGKTHFNAEIKRENVSLVWSDYDGTSYIYFDPDTQVIYIHNHYRTRTYEWFKEKFVEHHEYLKYTTDEFAQDPLNNILDILHLSSTLRNIINNSMNSEEKQSYATIENTLKSYSYNGSDTFNITLDLAPLTTDIKTTTVAIKHDTDFNLTQLNATVNMINIIEMKLYATLTTSDVSYGTDVKTKAIALDPNFN